MYEGDRLFPEGPRPLGRKLAPPETAGLGTFRIEKYTGRGWTDVVEFYEQWLREVVEPTRKPATVKGYRSYLANWVRPFFESHPVMLHEIQLDTICSLLNSIDLSGQGTVQCDAGRPHHDGSRLSIVAQPRGSVVSQTDRLWYGETCDRRGQQGALQQCIPGAGIGRSSSLPSAKNADDTTAKA